MRGLGGPLILAAAVALSLASTAGCVDKAAEAKKRADQQKSFMEAEAKAQAAEDEKEAKAAFAAADSGCSGGDASKCVDLGRLYADGKGVDKDAAKAVAAFAKACAHKDGCRQAAGAESDDKKRLDHLVALCDLGDVDGCMEGAKLADALMDAHKLPEPKKPADREPLKLLKKACALGQVVACTVRGVALVNDDPASAVESFGKGCDGGEPTSCLQLGALYKEGKGVKKKDEKKARELMKKACDAGLKDAC